jgi:hypothetical protein
VIQVFCDQHLGQESRGRDTLVDDLRRNRRLDQPLAATADPFATDMALDFEHPWGVIELFTDILADSFELAAAIALCVLGLVADFPTRELHRQRHAARLYFGYPRRFGLQRFDLKANGLQIRIDALIQQRALHGIELLTSPSIAPALEGGHLVRELLDLQLLVFDLFVAARQLRITFTELSIALGQLREQRRAQITQLLCVHLRQLALQLHGSDAGIFSVSSKHLQLPFFLTTHGSSCAHPAVPTAVPPPAPAAARE